MKSNELNLDVLENADEETVDSISEKYDAVSEEDISKLYRGSETMYKDKKNETGLRTSVDVAVVSQKRSSVLKKIAAFAAVLTLATGTVTGGVILLRRSVPVSDVVTENNEPVLVSDIVTDDTEPIPENIFEAASVPDELKDKTIIDDEPLYEYAYDFQDTAQNAAEASDLIIGKVNGITYTSRGGVAYTQVHITVSEDTEGKLSAGDNVDVEFVGGYISVKDQRESMGGIPLENGNENSEEESDVSEDEDIWCHEIVFSGEVPIAGKEYAFFVIPKGETSEHFNIIGQEYGVFYKCGNIYIQRRNSGYEFYDIDELKKLMEAEPSFSLPTQFTITEYDNQIDMNKLKEEYPEYFNMSYSNGIEIYVWQMAEECYRCGMIEVNGNRTSDEIYALQSKSLSVEETKAILAEIGASKDDIIIIPISQPYSSYFYEIDEAYKDKVIKLFE